MARLIIPIILITVSIIGFLKVLNPMYADVKLLKAQTASYNEALDNSKALEAERVKLTKQYNSFAPEDLSKIEKLLPNSVDNIRLILEIEKLASPYGMVLRDVRYDTFKEEDAETPVRQAGGGVESLPTEYGAWDLEFSTEGAYSNFLNFIRDLESNLRLVDISSIQFASDTTTGKGGGASTSEVYKYSFKIKTYWLRN